MTELIYDPQVQGPMVWQRDGAMHDVELSTLFEKAPTGVSSPAPGMLRRVLGVSANATPTAGDYVLVYTKITRTINVRH